MMPPDWNLAENHAKTLKPGTLSNSNANFSDEINDNCPCCGKIVNKNQISLGSNSKELEFLGFGFPLYFIFIKYCIILVLIMILTYNGMSLYWAIEKNWVFCGHRNLLASQQLECTSFMVMLSKINAILYQEEKILRILSFIAQFFVLIYMRDLIVKTMEYYDEKTTSLSDYSIQIKDIPLQDKVQQKIKGFINELISKNSTTQQKITDQNRRNDKITIQQIILLPQLTQYYKMIQSKKSLIQQKRKLYLKKEKLRIQNGLEFQQNQNQILIVNTKIYQHNQKIEQKKVQFKSLYEEDKLYSEKAIIIINSERQKNQLLKEFQHNKSLSLQLLRKYFGQSAAHIRIKQAPQPNQIIWANVNYSRRQKIIGHVIGWSFSILTLIAVTIVYYFLVYLKTQNLLNAIQSNQTLQTAHKDRNYIFAVILVYLNLFFIVIFNKFVLGSAFYKFTLLEKHQNTSNEEFSFAIKYALGMFFTTALMTLAVEDITFHNFYSHEYGVIEEESVMFFINAFFVPLIWLLNPQQIYVLIQRYFYKGKNYFTQQEANKIMSDSNYKMGKRYAEIIKTMWFTFLYSTLIPFGAFISLVGLSIYYWVDKYNLLRRSSIIQNISGKLAIKCMKLLDMTIFFRSMGALLFDYQLRNEVNLFQIGFLLIGLIYLLLPMNKILRFFHEEKFMQVHQSYESVKNTFRQTYRTLNPIYTAKILVPQIVNEFNGQNDNNKEICQVGDSLQNIYFIERNQQTPLQVYVKPRINCQNDVRETVQQINYQHNQNYVDEFQNVYQISKRSLRKRLRKIQFSRNQKENLDTLNVQNQVQLITKSGQKSNTKTYKNTTPYKITNIR